MDKYYYAVNGEQKGPFTLQELKQHHITRNTLMWKAGMKQWEKANSIAEVASFLFNENEIPPLPSHQSNPTTIENRVYIVKERQDVSYAEYLRIYPKPRSYLVFAILATIFCCVPAGIVSIVYASKVEKKYRARDYTGAMRASRSAKTWLILSIVLGIIFGSTYVLPRLPY